MEDEPKDPKMNFDSQNDPFVDHIEDDPFVEDHFGGRAGPKGNKIDALPDSTAILILGILSILGGFCYGITGVFVGIIALVMANKPERLYRMEPNRYTVNSYNNLKAGKVCAIIGLCLSIIMSFFFLILVIDLAG